MGHRQRATPARCSVRSCAAPAYSSLAASSVPPVFDGPPLPLRVTNFALIHPRLAIEWVGEAAGPWVDSAREDRGLDSVGSSLPEAVARDEVYSSFVVCRPTDGGGNCR